VRKDLVFDYSGQNLYISTSTGIIQTFNLSTLTFGTRYDLGGSLNGLDVARDNSFLVVAQNAYGIAEGAFQKVALTTGSVTNISYRRQGYDEGGAWDVTIGSNGLALVTTHCNLVPGYIPVRQIDLATNVMTIRQDTHGGGPLGTVVGDTQIHRSANGTGLFFMEGAWNFHTALYYKAGGTPCGSRGRRQTFRRVLLVLVSIEVVINSRFIRAWPRSLTNVGRE
jgi:hypothetical protein